MDMYGEFSGDSSDTIAGPPAPPPSLVQVFPDWVTIEWQIFMQQHFPGWEPEPHGFEPLYQSAVDQNGEPICTFRMAMWLAGLPGLGDAAHPAHEEQRRSLRALVGGLNQHGRPRSLSGPLSPFRSPAPGTGQQNHSPDTPVTIAPPAYLQPSVPGARNMTEASPSSQHPNPLGQHPVHHDQLLPPPHIPKRQSSLFFQRNSSDYANCTPSPAGHTVAAQEDITHRVQSLQLTDRSAPPTPAQDQADQTANMASRSDEVQPFFGADTGKTRESRKRSRSVTRTATVVSQPPTKRLRRTLTSARNRLSRVMTPAGIDDAPTGRHSRLERLTEAAKRMSLATPPGQPQMIQVTGFAPGVAKERVKIAFIGNTGVGKTTFIQVFRDNRYEENSTAAFADGYVVHTINVVLDGMPVSCEAWDVSSQCDETDFTANTIRPLLMTFYDAVVICHDVSDETTLKAAEAKWAHDAERFCTGSPTILLGLKADLRKPLPSLRLSHLREPTQTSFGQGEHTAKKMGVEAHYEASAKTGEGVADFFESTIRFALERRSGSHSEAPGPVSRAKKTWKGIKRHLG